MAFKSTSRQFSMVFILCASLCLGTTYIIKEGGVEVGRWEEPDGSDKVEVIENDGAPAAPKSATVETVQGSYGSGRRGGGGVTQQVQLPENTEKLAKWKVSGKVVDAITLKRLSGGTIVFTGPSGTEPVHAKVSPNGGFSTRLIALEGTGAGYDISVIPPNGYAPHPHIEFTRSLSDIPYRERLSRRSALAGLGTGWLNQTRFDMEIGLYTSAPTKQERADYQKVVLGRR